MNRILVADDDRGMRAALEARFLRRGWPVETAASVGEAMERFRRGLHPLIVSDMRMPGAPGEVGLMGEAGLPTNDRLPGEVGSSREDGLRLMREARSLAPRTAVILLTGFPSVPDAVTAIKDGAMDYLVKPVDFEQLEEMAARLLGRKEKDDENSLGVNYEGLCGRAPLWLGALERARRAAASDADVLIEAESGTGKELVARLIHRLGPRRERPFVAVNCAAFPETLLESELFGHAKGAFTGAQNAKPGKFELAHGGTLLLDEIGEMPLGLQPKLLRALQEREFDRLGDTRSVRVDLRVIATTNCALASMVREGRFRADLYYRLNVIPLSLPPLRERPGDVRELAEHFVRLYAPAGRHYRLTEEFLAGLEAHAWPGNVRELANCIRRAVALCVGSEIGSSALAGCEWNAASAIASAPNVFPGNNLRPGISLGEMERQLFAVTLAATGGNRSRAAEMLGVSLRTVRNKVRSYGLPSAASYGHD
jgi:DNA-binding NtrC family response regulator